MEEAVSVPYQPKNSGLSFPTASTYHFLGLGALGPVKAPEKSSAYLLVDKALSVSLDTGLSSISSEQGTLSSGSDTQSIKDGTQSIKGEAWWGPGAPTHPPAQVGCRCQGPLHTWPLGAMCLSSTPSAC